MTAQPPMGPVRGITSCDAAGFSRFLRGAFLAGAGFDGEELSRPLVGIGTSG